MKSFTIALTIWILTNVFGTITFLAYLVATEAVDDIFFCIPIAFFGGIATIPLWLVAWTALVIIERKSIMKEQKLFNLFLVCVIFESAYGLIIATIASAFRDGNWEITFLDIFLLTTGILVSSTTISILLKLSTIKNYFTSPPIIFQQQQSNQMETMQQPNVTPRESNPVSLNANRTMIKGIITGVLILVMLIPTVYITNLVNERKIRQQEVAAEVSSKWSSSQTLTGPYLYVPYKTYLPLKDGKVQEGQDHFWILPDNLTTYGNIKHEIRQRSIYKVLLYRADLKESGNFIINTPANVNNEHIQWEEAKLCFGLSDVKGIEEKLSIRLNEEDYELSPGLPTTEISERGLSAPVKINTVTIDSSLAFSMNLKLKGSEQLHFVPLAGNSSFSLQSTWPNPSFDGNNLPTERSVTQDGFTSKWTFNKANLPFGTVLQNFRFDLNAIAFGVTMLQPADQYAKTSRSVKYAILFIGLTFSLFFVVELMHKRPIHPVQYILIGIALVIFYTLLLSISEFIMFDNAYLIASVATILLISLYAQNHFKSWRSGGLFGLILTALYGFIFVLIRLEDTALLVGSIGLFIVLALTMYASRKVNWYGEPKIQ